MKGSARRRPTDMALHVIQAQHGSPVVAAVAFVFLLHASAQLELDNLGKGQRQQFSHGSGLKRGEEKQNLLARGQ